MALPRATVNGIVGAAEYNELVDAVDALNLPAFWADQAGVQLIPNAASGDGTTLTNYTTPTSREWVGTVLSSGVATIPIDGWYRVTLGLTMASASTSVRFLAALVGSNIVLSNLTTENTSYFNASTVLRLTSGDLIKMNMRQNSGGAVNATAFQFSVVCERAL